MAGQPAVADKFFAFLPHRCQKLDGTTVAVDATALNPGFLTSSAVTRNTALQGIVERRVREVGVATPRHPELRRLRFALVDLTGAAKLASPEFAGHEETKQGGIGSMAKTACMYAAFQLRFDLEELSRQKSITVEADLFSAARDAWNDTQKRDPANASTIFARNPKIELLGKLVEVNGGRVQLPRALSSPDLETIFDATPSAAGRGMDVQFKGVNLIRVDPATPGSPPAISDRVRDYVRRKGEKLAEVRTFSFAERLFLMIDESDNAASHSCIENVSYLYIASSLWQSDLYRPERGGGLWEASTHDGASRWVLPPVPQGAAGADFVSATAASTAALFTLIEQDRLVNTTACRAMELLMSKKKAFAGGSLTRSFFAEGLESLGFDRLHSKLGIGNFNNDGMIVERTVAPTPQGPAAPTVIRYVATGFDEPLNQDGAHLRTLILELDKCIQENNGLIAAATP